MLYGDYCSGEQQNKEKTKRILNRGDHGGLTEEDI